MFDDLVVSSANPKRTNNSWTVALSAIIQACLLGILILIPLIYTEALPKTLLTTFLVPPPPPPPPPPPAAAIQRIVKPIVRLIHNGQMMAPTVVPKKVQMIKEEEMPPDVGAVGVVGGVPGGVPGGQAGGVLGGIIGGSGSGMPPPPKATPSRIRVGGNVAAAKLVRQVTPLYPPIAKTAHISGTVMLHAVIAKDGTIQELTYVSGPPLLMKNAMDAVRQWKYQPTLLNGEPVEVDTTISVVFTLGGSVPPSSASGAPAAPAAAPPIAIDPQLKTDILHFLDVTHAVDRAQTAARAAFETLRPQLLAAMPNTPN